jgi:cytochrome d ubiquinol oxidase subunit II
VLDGFDLGVGILHLFVAKTDHERREIFDAIGPVWAGNEVWLVAAGGILVFAFPPAYAAAFSGLYLPLMITLWLLIGRGVAIELRSQLADPLWHAALDALFACASFGLALVLGVAMGNVVRGIPIDQTGYFQEDLFATRAHPGAIDAFTALYGVFAIVALAAHGATYLAMKTEGELRARSTTLGAKLWVVAIFAAALASIATALTQGAFVASAGARPWVWPLPAIAIGCAMAARSWIASGRERAAFLASCAFLALFLAATAGALFPVILRSTIDPAFSIDAYRHATPASSGVAFAICAPGLVLAIGYFVFLYRSFRGRITSTPSTDSPSSP